MSDLIEIIIPGANGRMGQTLLRLAEASDHFGPVHAISGHTQPNVNHAHVLVDFTHPDALKTHIEFCRMHKVALVLGTTGLNDEHEADIRALSDTVPVVYSANFSIGITVMTQLTERLAGILNDDFDIEITEAHHRHKQDAPGGTALRLGQAAARGRNVDFNENAVFTRKGQTGPRNRGDIGFSVIRGGNIIGQHDARFISDTEEIQLHHTAMSRDLFADGALRAARWVINKPPGLYDMADVLGLKD